jgi:hypothetical protein
LPDHAIVEMVTNVNEDISQNNIVKRFNALKCSLPEKWTQTIQTEIYTYIYPFFYRFVKLTHVFYYKPIQLL